MASTDRPAQPAVPGAVSHVFFDVDGTLVDLVGALRAAADAAAETIGGYIGRPVRGRELWERRAQAAAQRPDLPFEAVWAGCFADLLAEDRTADAHETEARVARALEHYHATQRQELRVYPDAAPALRALHGAGLRLVAASNGWVNLADVGLADLFAMTHYAGDIGVSKPDPAFYHAALRRAEVGAEAALMVGDRVDNDIRPAQEVGMRALWIARDPGVEVPAGVERVSSLAELPGLLLGG